MMQTITQEIPIGRTLTARTGSKAQQWAGRVLSWLAVLFLAFDSIAKLLQVQPVIDGTLQLGYPRGVVVPLGIILLSCVAVYVVPRTSILGAVLLTGYLGGAIATHVRMENPLFSRVLFPIYVAAFLWGGLLLRDARLRELFPIRRAS